jgi:hypothetical protein
LKHRYIELKGDGMRLKYQYMRPKSQNIQSKALNNRSKSARKALLEKIILNSNRAIICNTKAYGFISKEIVASATANGSINNSLFINSGDFPQKSTNLKEYINKMTAYQKAKILMAKGIIQLCDESTAIIALVAAFQTALTSLKAKIAEIEDTAELSSLSLTGIAVEKKNFKEQLCLQTADIAGMIYAYAVASGNSALKAEVALPVSRLKRKSDTELIAISQAIHDRGIEHKSVLDDYGITIELLAGLQAAIEDYAAAAPKPRTAISKRKTRKEILKQLFKELDEILNDRMDTLMGKFRTSHPEFYQTYFNLREIVDPSTTPTQLKGKITDAVTNAPVKNASIAIVELAKSTNSDSSGNYFFKPVEHGKFTVNVTAEGYANFQSTGVEVKLGANTTLNAALNL